MAAQWVYCLISLFGHHIGPLVTGSDLRMVLMHPTKF